MIVFAWKQRRISPKSTHAKPKLSAIRERKFVISEIGVSKAPMQNASFISCHSFFLINGKRVGSRLLHRRHTRPDSSGASVTVFAKPHGHLSSEHIAIYSHKIMTVRQEKQQNPVLQFFKKFVSLQTISQYPSQLQELKVKNIVQKHPVIASCHINTLLQCLPRGSGSTMLFFSPPFCLSPSHLTPPPLLFFPPLG